MRFAISKRCVSGVVVGLLAIAPMGCDKKAGTESAAEKSADMSTPEGMGEAVGNIFKSTIDELVKALESKPEPADAKAKATAIIEAAQKTLIEIGKKREALDAAGKATFDKTVMAAMQGMPSATFNKFSDIASHYRKADPALGNLISQANIITQYANYELLKKQSPAEAEKYGIK